MTAPAPAHHVVVDSARGRVVCKRCGAEHRIELPKPIDAFVRELRAFDAKHAACPEREAR